jgi:hypothetical protein
VFYPTDKIFGVVDDPTAAKEAVDALKKAGFADDDIHMLAGEEDAARVDVSGKQHGLVAELVRFLQKAGDYESRDIRIYQQELKEGHAVIATTAPKQADRDKALEVFFSFGAHFINFYGRTSSERLKS